MKQRIRLTESQLNRIIRNCINKALYEQQQIDEVNWKGLATAAGIGLGTMFSGNAEAKTVVNHNISKKYVNTRDTASCERIEIRGDVITLYGLNGKKAIPFSIYDAYCMEEGILKVYAFDFKHDLLVNFGITLSGEIVYACYSTEKKPNYAIALKLANTKLDDTSLCELSNYIDADVEDNKDLLSKHDNKRYRMYRSQEEERSNFFGDEHKGKISYDDDDEFWPH